MISYQFTIITNSPYVVRNEQVVGSIPIISSSVINASEVFGGFFCVVFYACALKSNQPVFRQNRALLEGD